MTIAAGFIASDGILLFADTQYTGFEKRYKEKIVCANTPGALVHFAVSGDVDYAQSAIEDSREEISEMFLNGNRSPSVREIRKVIREAIKKAIKEYEERSLDATQKPEFLISIGSHKDGLRLFSSRETAVPPVSGYDFRGSGSSIASYVMQSFGPRSMSLPMVALLPIALHILAAAYKHDAYCGGGAQFVGITYNPHGSTDVAPGFRASSTCTIDRPIIDTNIKEYEHWCGALLSLAIGDTSLSDAEFKNNVEEIVERMSAIRDAINTAPSAYLQLVESIKSITSASSHT